MRQILFRIPVPGLDRSLTLYGYGAMLCLGFLAAIYTAVWRARRRGRAADTVYNAAMLAFLGGVFGARIFFLVQKHFQYGHPLSLWELVKIWEGGLVYYGGLAAAAAAIVAYFRLTRRPVLYWADLIAPSLALGLALGRGGCTLNGCCYGDVSALPWAFSWPVGSIPWHRHAAEFLASHGTAATEYPGGHLGSLMGSTAAVWRMPPIHPAQGYAILNGLLLFGVLSLALGRKRRHGQVLMLFLLLYGTSRFVLEFLRGDEAEAYLLGLPWLLSRAGMADLAGRLPLLTISQNVAMVAVAASLVGFLWLGRTKRPELQADYVPPRREAEHEKQDGQSGRRKGKRR
jgi:phosphatidylglycerol:prolipoprotein diacylglycerol transferase